MKSICTACALRRPPGDVCEAFPNGIPIEILDGAWDHRRPLLDDDEQTFVQADDEWSRAEFARWEKQRDYALDRWLSPQPTTE